MTGNSPYRIVLSEVERTEFGRISSKCTSPYHMVVRAKIALMAAGGLDNKNIGSA